MLAVGVYFSAHGWFSASISATNRTIGQRILTKDRITGGALSCHFPWGVRAPSNNGCLDQPKSISQTAPRSVHTFCRVVTIKLDRLGKIFEYLEKLKQTRGCLVHFLRLLAVHWPGAQSTRYNHILACNFARYSPILIFFSLTDSARLACFLTF